jgi:hypothetical protein
MKEKRDRRASGSRVVELSKRHIFNKNYEIHKEIKKCRSYTGKKATNRKCF